MASIRQKRSNEGGSSRRQELEDTLAALRDQETVLTRAIELVQASLATPGKQKQGGGYGVPSRPTAELKDLHARQKQVQEDQRRRAKGLWGEIRKMVKHLKAKGVIKNVFGTPVRSSQWAATGENWKDYCKHVSHPMDIGTIQKQLAEDDNKREYQSPMEVKAHIELIVANARAANVQQAIVDAALDLETTFNDKWREGRYEQKWNSEQQRRKLEQEVRAPAHKGQLALVRGSVHA